MKVVLVFRDPSRGGKSVEEIYKGLYDVFRYHIDVSIYFYQDSKSVWYNRRELYRFGASIFHITSDLYWLTFFLPRKSCVITIHDIGHYLGMSGWRQWVYGLIYFRFPIKWAATVTTVSDFTRNSLRELVPASLMGKIVTIHNPVPHRFDQFPVSPLTKSGIILQIGTSPHKNCESVIQALTGLPYSLHIIGPLSQKQKELLFSCKVKYKQSINASYEQIYRAFLEADLVSFISFYEGFGMPVLEAQAAGRPVITSTRASLPEVAGYGAYFIDPPDDFNAIRKAILRLMQDKELREEQIESGITNIGRFDRTAIANAYLKVYKAV